MEFRRRIAATVVLILLVFLMCFLVMLYCVNNTLMLNDIKNRSTETLLSLYRLYFGLKSILFTTTYSTQELKSSLEQHIEEFERGLQALVRDALAAMRSYELFDRSDSVLRLWQGSRRRLQRVLESLDDMIRTGLDERTGLLVSRLQYSRHLIGTRLTKTRDHFYLVSLENNIETATAAAPSFYSAITSLAEEVKREADVFIVLGIVVAGLVVASVAGGAVIFTLLYGRLALVRQVERLLHETLVQEEEKRTAQINALRYQINPHFLYNTLAAIRAAAVRDGGGEVAAEMLLCLSRYLRKVFRDTSALVSVGTELDNVREYMRIHELRFRERLAVRVNALAPALSAALPPFLIQPIVENAILHGLSRRLNSATGGARLEITASVHGSTLDLEIEDNGEGMAEAQVAAVLREESPAAGLQVHIGLRNIHERIQLKFGPAFGVHIHSRPGQGTHVRLHLPLLPAAGTSDA